MGINELLKILRPQIIEKHLSEFSGQTAAVDMMAWIYRGAYASAVDVGQGKKSDLYLNFPLKMLALLKSHNINCIAVFDGKKLKAKEIVEDQRNENKNKNLEQAKKLQAEGKEEESKKIYRRALKIKSRMINSLIEIIKSLCIRCVIAPYEADSQIAFICKSGMADFAITEDSDLIPFGVDRIAYKLDANGNFSYLDMQDFRNIPLESILDPHLKLIKKIFSNHLRLVEFCVMLGCDYLPSIKGYGFKTALNLFETYEKLDTVLHQMKFIDKFKKNLPDRYSENVKKCVSLFFLQTVYNPIENKLQPLTDLNVYESDTREQVSIKEHLSKTQFENCEDFYGPVKFEKFKEFCRGSLDVKTFDYDKKLEDKEVIKKYINRFKGLFNKSPDLNFDNEAEKEEEEVQNLNKEELEQLINFNEESGGNYLNNDVSEINVNPNPNQNYNYNQNQDYKQTNNEINYNDFLLEDENSNNGNKIININNTPPAREKVINDEEDLEMQYYLQEIAKKEKSEKKKITSQNNFNNFNHNDEEISNILKLCESLSKSDNKVSTQNVNQNPLQNSNKKDKHISPSPVKEDNNNTNNNNKFYNIFNNRSFSNTPNKSESFINVYNSSGKKDNSTITMNTNNFSDKKEKPVKNLFDILEKEKQETLEANTNFNSGRALQETSALKLPPPKNIISPNFSRIMQTSPLKQTGLNMTNIIDRSPNKPILAGKQLFNKNSPFKTQNFTQKSPDEINPLFMKRKYNELQPKSLEFEQKEGKGNKSEVKNMKNMDIYSFVNKKFKEE